MKEEPTNVSDIYDLINCTDLENLCYGMPWLICGLLSKFYIEIE